MELSELTHSGHMAHYIMVNTGSGMAWCLTAPSHYLNQWWLVFKDVLWHSPKILSKLLPHLLKLILCILSVKIILSKLLPHLLKIILCILSMKIILPKLLPHLLKLILCILSVKIILSKLLPHLLKLILYILSVKIILLKVLPRLPEVSELT